MIEITRLNDQKYVINALYIEKVESLPDTTITLINGKKHFVKDSAFEVTNKVMEFYQSIGLLSLVGKEVIDDE